MAVLRTVDYHWSSVQCYGESAVFCQGEHVGEEELPWLSCAVEVCAALGGNSLHQHVDLQKYPHALLLSSCH